MPFENHHNHPQLPPILHYYAPTTPFIRGFISIPHSGEFVPQEFRAYLAPNERAWAEDVDYRVHQLIDIDRLRQAGVAVLRSEIHRVAVDLNRSPEKSVLHWEKNTKGETIRLQAPSEEKSLELREEFYAPYFEVIKNTLYELEKVYNRKKAVPVVDLHSMPSRPTDYHLKINPQQKMERPDFCISDLRGKACGKEYIDFICQDLREQNYNVNINDPYFGGYVTEYMSKFSTNAIQIEIKRGLYMDEEKKVLIEEKVKKLKPHLTESLIRLFTTFGLNQI